MLVSLQESSPNKFEDTDSILEMSRKSLSRYHGKILYGLNTLGPVVTLEVLYHLIIVYLLLFLKSHNGQCSAITSQHLLETRIKCLYVNCLHLVMPFFLTGGENI
jgi:hypothetical protein